MNSIIAWLIGFWFGSVIALVIFFLISKDSEDHHDHE